MRSASRSPAVHAAGRLEFAVADLVSADGWADAMAGVDYVIHPASPLHGGDPIVPAREGALNVLRAATEAGVKRVVMTFSEDDPSFPAYRRSKIIAERAAWDFMAGHEGPTTLTTVLPGAVFGPVLTRDNLRSVAIIEGLMSGRMVGVPRIGLEIVDVRDVIDLHLDAMTAPDAAGERFLGTAEFMWMADVARTLGVTAPTLSDEAARNDPSLTEIVPALGRRAVHSTDKAKRLLGWQPRPAAETVLDAARSIREWRATE